MPKAAFFGLRHSESDGYFVKCMAEFRVVDESESLAASRASAAEPVDTYNPYAADPSAEAVPVGTHRLSVAEVIAGLLLGSFAAITASFFSCVGITQFGSEILDTLGLQWLNPWAFFMGLIASVVLALLAFVGVYRSMTRRTTRHSNQD